MRIKKPAIVGGVILVLVALGYVGLKVIFPPRPPEVAVVTPQHPAEVATVSRGQALYQSQCAFCHGDKGDGRGPAARFLYPKPRNFSEGKFRIVSTLNQKPSDDDLFHVISRGMPGSAMFPFGHLSESDRRELVAQVRTLMRSSMEERFRREAVERGEEVDAQELAQAVQRFIEPGKPLAAPEGLATASKESVLRGVALYQKSCSGCHGPTGKGDGAEVQQNDDGTPTRPRDFTRGLFKGGREFDQLYARIMLGLPGSPMPSAGADRQPGEAADLVHYVLSLSRPAAQAKVEHKRTQISARRVASSLAAAIPEDLWKTAPAAGIVVSPLWWRDYSEPDLQVQALHDGQTLALRLSWQDETMNDQAVRPQDFEDMAAVQLFQGEMEPFLGMGSADHAVDVWLWRAGWKGSGSPFADVNTVYPNMAVDMYPQEGPEFLTARATGNLRSDPNLPFTGNSLQARGFGTLTMRPKVSQLVEAKASWQGGRWTVVLRRPLQVPSDGGLSLKAGDKLSIALALFDGAARDRNGQKLVSIWHDLTLE